MSSGEAKAAKQEEGPTPELVEEHRCAEQNGELHLLDLTDPESRPRPWLTEDGPYRSPELSPDGSRLACTVGRGRALSLAVMTFDPQGEPDVQRIEGDFSGSPMWSADSRTVVVEADEDGPLSGSTRDETGAWSALQPLADPTLAEADAIQGLRDGRTLFRRTLEAEEDPHGLQVVLHWDRMIRRLLED